MGTILLEGMEFFSFHGCFKEEQIIGTTFIVDLKIVTGLNHAEESDCLQDTVDYTAVYRCIKQEMDQKSHLLEHVSHRIIESIKTHFPVLDEIELKIAKINPPVGGKVRQVCYQTQWKK
ncbi:MAG: dihydroneopterin aldolase [Bacteroidales bacterium]|nr:dihydroneopterin aldolase [Bacteroidales bacterium]MDD4602406.1 dihydroneopterin aldolase [Bacteroidales bacterium]